ncbi:hypothetical protein PENTCL1PPCAC_4181, partial [Pristionchus entomophagus]
DAAVTMRKEHAQQLQELETSGKRITNMSRTTNGRSALIRLTNYMDTKISLDCLSRLTRRMRNVEQLNLRRMDFRKLGDVHRVLGTLHINTLNVTFYCEDNDERVLRTNLSQLIRLHSIDTVRSDTSVGLGQGLHDFIVEISKSASVVCLIGSCMGADKKHNMIGLFAFNNDLLESLEQGIVNGSKSTWLKLECSCGVFQFHRQFEAESS